MSLHDTMPANGLSPFAGMDAASFLVQRTRHYGDRPLILWAPFDGPERSWTYAAFLNDVQKLAGGLSARGIGPGDRLLIHLENCPETLLARFACVWLGAVAVISNAMASATELRDMIDQTGARAAITQPRLSSTVDSAGARLLDWIAVTSTDAGDPASAETLPAPADRFDALMGDPAPQRAPDPTQPALILFTTGTTARAKAVLWTHENLLWASSLGAQQQGFRDGDVAQVFLPLFHVVGFSWTFLPLLWVGGAALLQPRFSASRFWSAAQRHRATISPQVPFTLGALAGHPVPDRHDFRFWIVNRQIPEEQARFRVPGIVSAWGMTEMVSQPIVGVQGNGDLPAQAMGRPSAGYTIRVVAEDGTPVAPGEIGELLVGGVRGRSIFLEYDRNPDANAEAFTPDGFFRTGDRVRQLDCGVLVFVDRIKDVLKVGGEGVSSAEIEAVIRRAAGVQDVAVVPRPDALRGEVPVAFVVADPDRPSADDALREAILAHCTAEMARFKVPREIRFLEALPRVGFGKIAKGKLRAMAAEGQP
ncbi:AMP-binding protein [Rhodobacter sp. NTK016B]|uniref:class I adenylate-forming enzyme family protein n=1 Tax=Rhodobacter sp. NTK016B TaxID=2759676 RepID=UPI001A906188|nr:AMP-binding protein [Rhodobacter sp. NTK016B]MBN8290995.1 AMP-binding protein [Rhodobacter sp. NTK016B]